MGKIMALDVGSKTIGVAFCEEGTRLAFPGKTLVRREGKRRDMAALRELIALNDVRRIVVGMPLFFDGTRGIQAEKVDAFIATLRNSVRIPIITQDEGLSTSEAAELLRSAGKRPAIHKRTIDSVAAALILEWYLEEQEKGERKKEKGQDVAAGTSAFASDASIPSPEPPIAGKKLIIENSMPETPVANG